MQITQISSTDLPGRIFNGYDLQVELNKRGILAKQYVVNKRSEDLNSITLSCGNTDIDKDIRNKIINLEKSLSVTTLLSNNNKKYIEQDLFYQNSDIQHFHIFYNGMLSIFDFVNMVKNKKSVWTIHDFWALTGHCIYPIAPFECDGWKHGCKPCPDLNRYYSMNVDNAGSMWQLKNRLYKQINPDIVVATSWLEKYIKESPLTNHFTKIHKIPFGVYLDKYGSIEKEQARKNLSIANDEFVIAFRSDFSSNYTVKGTEYIWEALRHTDRKIHLLTVGYSNIPEDIQKKFPSTQLGWVNDLNKMIEFFSACDVFLMPSTAETFGLMSIEAMASSKPIIVFENTVLMEVTHAPECGLAVPYKNSKGLLSAIHHLMDNNEERLYRGLLGRNIAEKYYNFDNYINKHIELYNEILNR